MCVYYAVFGGDVDTVILCLVVYIINDGQFSVREFEKTKLFYVEKCA